MSAPKQVPFPPGPHEEHSKHKPIPTFRFQHTKDKTVLVNIPGNVLLRVLRIAAES